MNAQPIFIKTQIGVKVVKRLLVFNYMALYKYQTAETVQ